MTVNKSLKHWPLVAARVLDMTTTFIWQKITKLLTTIEAREKLSTDLESSNF